MILLAVAAYALTPALRPAAPTPPAVVVLVAPTLAANSPPAEFIFLLDTTAEMLPVTSPIVGEIASLVEVLPEGDRIEIVIFHARPNVALSSTIITEAGRAALARQIRSLAVSATVDRDLGAGLDALVTQINRKEAPSLEFAFIASNFCHAPLVSSRWSSGAYGCSPIRGQSSIGESLSTHRAGRLLTTVLFPLAPAGSTADGAGVDAAARELDATPVVADLPGWFADYRAHLADIRVRPVVVADAAALTLTAEVITAPGTAHPEVELELRTSNRVAGLRLDKMQVKGGKIVGAGAPELAPNTRIKIAVTPPGAPLSLFPRSDTVNLTLSLVADGVLLPEAEIAALGIDANHPNLAVAVKVPFHRQYGLPLPLTITVFVLVFFLGGGGAIAARARLKPRRLGGSFHYRFQNGPRVALPLADLAEAALVVKPDNTIALGAPAEAALIFRMRRPVWEVHAEVEVNRDDVELNRKRLARGRHAIVEGGTAFTFGEFRLTWE